MRVITSDRILRLRSSLLLILAFALSQAHAAVRLPSLFSDHMVMQADKIVPVWGWADAGEKVTVSIGGQSQSVVTGTDGSWRVSLEPLKPAPSQELIVQGTNRVVVNGSTIGGRPGSMRVVMSSFHAKLWPMLRT